MHIQTTQQNTKYVHQNHAHTFHHFRFLASSYDRITCLHLYKTFQIFNLMPIHVAPYLILLMQFPTPYMFKRKTSFLKFLPLSLALYISYHISHLVHLSLSLSFLIHILKNMFFRSRLTQRNKIKSI